MAAQKPEFTRVGRLQRGYDVDDVDAFLRQFARALEQGREVPDVMEARFTSPFGGYDMVEVDEFLEDLRSQMAPPKRSTLATVDDLPVPPAFATSRVRRGYNVEQVDAFLADVTAAVREGREPPSVFQTSFTSTHLSIGYSEVEVDDYLDELAKALGQ